MHNYWLKKKEIKAKAVTIKWATEGAPRTQVHIEMECGRKYRCEARSDHNNGVPILTTWFESYDDERFDYKCKEPFDLAVNQARYDVAEKIGLSILLSTGELRYEDYKDMHDYYANVDVGLPGYELPKVIIQKATECNDSDYFIARMKQHLTGQ